LTKQNNIQPDSRRQKKQDKKIAPVAAIKPANPIEIVSDERGKSGTFEDSSFCNGSTVGKL
jgi:hypothetical protein